MKKGWIALMCCAAATWAPAAWLESGGYVVMEAEHGQIVDDWITRPSTYTTDATMAGSLGDGWLEWTGAQFSGNTRLPSAVEAVIRYEFNISTEGDYFFRWRTKQYNDVGAGDAGNDTFVRFASGTPVAGYYDFGNFTKVWVQNKTAWDWRTAFEPSYGDQYYNVAIRHYSPGTHAIELAARSPGHAIDRMVIYRSDLAFNESTVNAMPESATDGAIPGVYRATNDFPNITAGEVPYYVDAARNALAINAANTSYRGKFARAQLTYGGASGNFNVTITTLTEEDGESTYHLLVNGSQAATYQNPRVGAAGDSQPHLHTWSNIVINAGDILAIESDTHSNGLIPESGGFAWSRGRWRQIQLVAAEAPPPPSAAENTPTAGIYGERSPGGSFKKWHKVSIAFEGPSTSETANPNPFTNYRLDVAFTHPGSGKSYKVPGYYAADGNAGETGATTGRIWRVHFAPDETGTWNYTASFRTGTNVAVDDAPTAGTATGFDGASGFFVVVATDKGGADLRGKGRLVYDGTRYLKHAETGEAFIKTGSDAPETFLGYNDFDGTYGYDPAKQFMKTWGPHVQDWKTGDPAWMDGKGKGMIGALNYLASEEMNVFSFLTYNVGGDGRNVWPFIDYNKRLQYDCSKLDQWEIVFSHADTKGLYKHFKTQEMENDNGSYGLDGGDLGIERKLYYRELIARFGHHLALNWNLGEENGQTTLQQQQMAQYFHDHDPYGNNIVLHTLPDGQESVYRPLLGSNSKLTGCSIQINYSAVHGETLQWIAESTAAGRPWIVANDEQGSALWANPPDDGYPGYPGGTTPTQRQMRSNVVWGNLMAGGAGAELYAGYSMVENDLEMEDYRSRNRMWDYCRHAKHFFNAYLPFAEMANANGLIGNTGNNNDKYCFAKAGQVYAIYLANGGTTTLNLSGASGTFPVYWFNPRDGGTLIQGSITSVTGGSTVSIGNPPADSSLDWAVLVGSAVDAGPDQAVNLPQEGNQVYVTLDGTVLMAAPYTVQWSFVQGPGSVQFTDATAEDTAALITGGPGLYTLQLAATSGGTTISNTMVVDVDAFTLSGNVAPAFTTNSMARANATATQEYNDTLTGSAFDLNATDVLTYSKVAGPAWLNIAASGVLSGIPGLDDVGLNEFIVRVQDPEGAFDTAALYIAVDESPSVSDKLNPVADAYVQGGSFAGDNFGTAAELLCKADPGNESFTRMAYLRFDLSSLDTNTMDKVTLRLKVAENYGTGGAHTLQAVADDNWGETTLTWSNKPAAGAVMDSATPAATGWIELDVTAQVFAEMAGDQVASFVLSSADPGLVKYASREAAAGSRPELLIEINSPPAFNTDPINLPFATEGVAYTGTIDGSAADVNPDDVLTYSKVDGPAWLSVAPNGTLSGTPGAGDVGPNAFTVKVEDSWLAHDIATLALDVASNAPPAFSADPINLPAATEGTAYAGSLDGMATDANAGNALAYSKVAGPGWLNVAANGTLSGTPGAGDVGPNAFTVMVEDQLGAMDMATLNIAVALAVSPPASTNIVHFTTAEGYANGSLKTHADWTSEKNPLVADAAGSGWAVIDPLGYEHTAYSQGVPYNQDAFTVTMVFSFTDLSTAVKKPLMNIGFYSSSNAATAERLKASINRDFAAGYYIGLEGTGWYSQLGLESPRTSPASIGIDIAGGDTNSALLMMTATLTRGATATDWAMTTKLYNLDADPTASTPLLNYTATGITHAGLYAATTLYGGFGCGQSDSNAQARNRKIDRFSFIGENLGGGSAWKQFIVEFGLNGIPGHDSDGDGDSDLYEFAMGGNPTNPGVKAMGIGMAYHSNSVVSLYHPAVAHDNPGIVYRAEWCTNLIDGTWVAAWDEETTYPTANPDYDESEHQVWGGDKDAMYFRVVPELP